MDNYKIKISTNFKSIRELFGWSQNEIAERLGVSRQLIIKVENEALPKYYLSKSVILALFLICKTEIEDRETKKNNLDYSMWDNKVKRSVFLQFISINIGISELLLSSLSASSFGLLGLSTGSALLGPAGLVIASVTFLAGIMGKKKTLDSIEITKEDFKKTIDTTFDAFKSEVSEKFDIQSMNSSEFISKLNSSS